MKELSAFLKSKRRRFVLFAVDLLCILFAFAFAWILIMGTRINNELVLYSAENAVVILLFLAFAGAYSRIWRYAQMKYYVPMAFAVVGAMSLCFTVSKIAKWPTQVQAIVSAPQDSARLMYVFILFACILCIILVIGVRMAYRTIYEIKGGHHSHGTVNRKRTLIVGAGQACWLLLAEIQNTECEYSVVGVVDDDGEKIGRNIQGVSVYGPIEKVKEVAEKVNAEIIIIAIPSADKEAKRRIVGLCNETNIEVKIIPEIYNILDKNKLISQMRKINTEDLLGREPVLMDVKESGELICGKVVMVTGGGGSIGSELCRQIIAYKPKRLVIVDISENSAYDIQQEILSNYGADAPITVHISSVRDFHKMDVLFEKYTPALVFHAAAHKHVPLMENDPEEALKNNVAGTYNVAFLANKYKAKRFLLISSDKAVNPTNVMGATKRFCEMLIQHFDSISENTEYCAVRFGNVLGSNGSVIPLFNKLIEQKKDLPVTHPEITRYFMTIPEAVSLVLRAGAMANGGEIFVLDMGTPVKIADLAKNLIRLHGYIPDKDIKIKYVGLRPGEKPYEELLMGDNLSATKHGKIFIEETGKIDSAHLMECYDRMCTCADSNDSDASVKALAEAVPTFHRAVCSAKAE